MMKESLVYAYYHDYNKVNIITPTQNSNQHLPSENPLIPKYPSTHFKSPYTNFRARIDIPISYAHTKIPLKYLLPHHSPFPNPIPKALQINMKQSVACWYLYTGYMLHETDSLALFKERKGKESPERSVLNVCVEWF